MNKNCTNKTQSIPLDQESDKTLLARISQGDKTAFSIVMQRYLSSVTLFVMRYFSQRSEAEDIAQEVFIRLWCKAPVWEDKDVPVKAWLYRVAYNLCIDQSRKQKLEYGSDYDERIIDENAFIEKLIGAEAELAVQKMALDNLPERQRTAIMLCAIKGLSNKETAIVMGISIDALESLLARARRKLKKLYNLAIEQQQTVVKEMSNDVC